MRTFNTPAQARSLREIEAAAMTPVTEKIKEVYADTQKRPEATPPETKEEGQAEETKETPKKSRSKKNTKKV